MAEILLSLTIIGVVAAITLPSLTGNINERTWNTQRKAIYARFSQAISLMPALNGYGTLDDTSDTAAETFITAGLSKVLKINNICDSEHIKDCGFTSKITTLGAQNISLPLTMGSLNSMLVSFSATDSMHTSYNTIDTKVAAFETANGESILAYYNPKCINIQTQASTNTAVWVKSQPEMCANFIYDLNGSKGPNTVGKDIGVITVIGASDSKVVAPYPHIRDINGTTQSAGAKACTTLDNEYRMPGIEEVQSMYYNRKLFNLAEDKNYWSSSLWKGSSGGSTSILGWGVDAVGRKFYHTRTLGYTVRCVKR